MGQGHIPDTAIIVILDIRQVIGNCHTVFDSQESGDFAFSNNISRLTRRTAYGYIIGIARYLNLQRIYQFIDNRPASFGRCIGIEPASEHLQIDSPLSQARDIHMAGFVTI